MGEMPLSRRTFLSAAGIAGLTAPILSACGTSGPGTAKGGGKTLQAWVLVDQAQNRVQNDAISDFNKSSKTKVKLLPISSSGTAYTDKLRVSMGSPNPPDLLFNWGSGSIRNYVQAGQLMDLGPPLAADTTWKNSFLPSVLEAGKIDGKYYGIPLRGMQPVILFYNKTLFADQGRQPPKTYDEMLKLVDFFTSKSIQPFALGGLDQWPNLMWLEYLVERAGGPTVFENIAADKPGAWRDPSITTALRQIQDLVKRGAFGTNFNSVNYVNDGASLLFAKGKAAMHLMGTWEVSNQVDRHKQFATNDLSFAPFPSVAGGKGDPLAVVGNPTNYFSVNVKSGDKDGAIAFLKKEMSSATYVDALIKTGDVPAVTGIESKLAASPTPDFSKYVYQLVQKAPNFTLSWDHGGPVRAGLVADQRGAHRAVLGGADPAGPAPRSVGRGAAAQPGRAVVDLLPAAGRTRNGDEHPARAHVRQRLPRLPDGLRERDRVGAGGARHRTLAGHRPLLGLAKMRSTLEGM